jgi:hypothetical protein
MPGTIRLSFPVGVISPSAVNTSAVFSGFLQ